MNLILTGMRGSGKSKIGKILAKKLKMNFIDIDEEVEKINKQRISELVKEKSWEYFRQQEQQATKSLENTENSIIATGGGTIIYPENYKVLKNIGTIIYLKRSPEDCFKYIKNSKNRPNLTKEKDFSKDLKKTYQQRKEIYEKTANISIPRSNNLELDAEKIIKSLSATSN